MADAILGVVFENLQSSIKKELATVPSMKEKFQRLSETLCRIEAVLADAEDKQITDPDPSVQRWLNQVKETAYELKDIIDECFIQSNRFGGLSVFKPKNIIRRHKIGRKLKQVTERFDQIVEAKNKFLLQEIYDETSSIIAEPSIYGRDDDKEKIVDFLLTQAKDCDFLSVYPIVGLAGVGKSTLAQLVYNDDKVISHFDVKIWIHVSEHFSVKEIMCTIIQSLVREKYGDFDLDVIQRKVQQLLQGNRYLLVLDDVWKSNEELEFGLSHEKWYKLKSVLSCGLKGASILVSTRDEEVATIMGTCQAHHLFGLSYEDCWSLFKQYAFGSNKEERQDLVEIGRQIVKKCEGSPLAAQALGSLLYSKSDRMDWLKIMDSRLWDLQDEKSILPVLRLRCFSLKPTLKQCFAFCAIFPKDEEICKEELIHLWMANGFISSRERLEVEDVGNMIWNELYQKSLFQDVRRDNYSGDIFFKMQDLVHGLAQSVMEQECLILDDENLFNLSKSTRHIRFNFISSPSKKKQGLQAVESLQTAYEFGSILSGISKYFPTNSSLRVLRTSSSELSSLGKLINLRYLELRGSQTKTLPDSICGLKKLEILKLISCNKLSCLPNHLSCLQKLRHLVIDQFTPLYRMFPGIRNLSDLRTLSKYIVSSKKGHSLAELHDLKLGGKLCIEGLENVTSSNEAGGANLVGKENLQELCLSWHINTVSHASNVEEVLEKLQPHSNLKILRIESYEGLNMPRWMAFLNNLDTLDLGRCRNCVQLPSLGKLQCLRKLDISFMDNLEYMDDGECYDGVQMMAFQLLEELNLLWLPELKRMLKVEKGNMCPRLSILSITNCPKLELLCLPYGNLTSLDLWGGPDNKMTCFPEGMMRNLTSLTTLKISSFDELKELPDELLYLQALQTFSIQCCFKLECLPEGVWEGLSSLRNLHIISCPILKSLPEGVRHLTLQILDINSCPNLTEWRK